MLVRKEIRIVGLGFCKPDGMTLQDWVDGLKDKNCFISYDRTNEFDSNCMVARVDGDAIGNVNADDQRFVEPLLVNAAFTECEYKECYYTDSGNAILRYTIIIDLEDVSRFLPGEAWNDWSYDGELMPVIEDWKGVEFHLALLKRQLVMSVTPDRRVVEMCLDAIEKSSFNDLSYETTNDLMDLSFMMEMNSSPYCAEWKNRIQQISTHRRSRRVVSASINRWYQNLLKGEEVRRMLELYNKTLMLRCKHENITDTRPLLKEEFDKMTDFVVLVKKSGWAMDEPLCKYDSIRSINTNLPLLSVKVSLWQQHKNVNDKYHKQCVVAEKLMKLLEIL